MIDFLSSEKGLVLPSSILLYLGGDAAWQLLLVGDT